jgi:hypothetical protein
MEGMDVSQHYMRSLNVQSARNENMMGHLLLHLRNGSIGLDEIGFVTSARVS